MDKIVEYRGIENLVYAEVTKDDATGITFGAVKKLAGVAELSKEVESSKEVHYYDNKPAVVIDSVGNDNITINASALDLETLADITGQAFNQAKGLLIEGSKSQKYFAIGYKTEMTDGSVVYVWRLKGTFAIPNSSHKTKNDGADADGQELTYTGINTTYKFNNGGSCRAINVDGSKTSDVAFFDEVLTPDTFEVSAG